MRRVSVRSCVTRCTRVAVYTLTKCDVCVYCFTGPQSGPDRFVLMMMCECTELVLYVIAD